MCSGRPIVESEDKSVFVEQSSLGTTDLSVDRCAAFALDSIMLGDFSRVYRASAPQPSSHRPECNQRRLIFGPPTPIYSATGNRGLYPLTTGNFRARINGVDAPVIAVARGLIAVPVPFESPATSAQGSMEVFENGSPLNSLPCN